MFIILHQLVYYAALFCSAIIRHNSTDSVPQSP